MNTMSWTNDQSVKIKDIDDQHKNLIALFNSLYETLGTKRDNEAKRLMGLFVRDLKIHFDTENNLMKEYQDLNYISHKLEHDRYLNKATSFGDKVMNNEASVNLQFLNNFKEWFYSHLELNDKKTGEFLYSKGLR